MALVLLGVGVWLKNSTPRVDLTTPSEEHGRETDRNDSKANWKFRMLAIVILMFGISLLFGTVTSFEGLLYQKGVDFLNTLLGKTGAGLNRTVTVTPSVAIFVFGLWWLLSKSIVITEQFECKVVNDNILRQNDVYGGKKGGWGIKTPWSKVTSVISLIGETLGYEGKYVTSDAEWTIKFGFVITPDPKRLFNYVERGGQKAVEEEFIGIASGRLAAEMARHTTIGLFNGSPSGRTAIEDLRERIEDYFREKADHSVSEFEEGYGVNVEEFRIESMTPSTEAMASLGDALETTAIGTMVKRLRDEFGFDFQEAVQIATLFGSKGDKARKSIIETRSKGGKGGVVDASLAALLAGHATGGHGHSQGGH